MSIKTANAEVKNVARINETDLSLLADRRAFSWQHLSEVGQGFSVLPTRVVQRTIDPRRLINTQRANGFDCERRRESERKHGGKECRGFRARVETQQRRTLLAQQK